MTDDPLAPARGILVALLISVLVGLALWLVLP